MLLHQGKKKNDLIYHGISKKGHNINDKHNKGQEQETNCHSYHTN
jgi:hypothetical protein